MIELGFELELDPAAAYGINVDKTVPTEVWLRKRLRTLDQVLLQDLLHATVRALQEEIPESSQGRGLRCPRTSMPG